MKKLLAVAVILTASIYIIVSEVNAMGEIIIPEPSLSIIKDESWEVDISKMKEYYDVIFSGKTPEQITSILDNENVQNKFISEYQIQFIPRKRFSPC